MSTCVRYACVSRVLMLGPIVAIQTEPNPALHVPCESFPVYALMLLSPETTGVYDPVAGSRMPIDSSGSRTERRRPAAYWTPKHVSAPTAGTFGSSTLRMTLPLDPSIS